VATNAFSRLLATVQKPQHDKRPSIEVFPDLDLNRIAVDLELERRGAERGARNEPPTASIAMDEIEARITERIEAEKKSTHAIVEDQLRTYSERLSALDFEGRFAAIRQAAPACVGEFRAEVAKGLDRLHGLRRDLREAEDERDQFRKDHRLSRTARVRGHAGMFVKIAIIISIFIIETILNGNFLARGSEQGMLGGVMEASAFAFLNIGAALLLAFFGVVEINHRSWLRRAIGVISLFAYIGFTIGLNLSLAHYRDASASLTEGGGEHVIQQMISTPWSLRDLNSWIFFGIGVLFSVITFIDGILLSDPYPGYASVQNRLEAKREEYIDGRADLIDQLGEIRDRYRDEMEELNRDLSIRRTDHDAILSNRMRLIQLFDQHQSHLERAGTLLLGIYREANTKARSDKPPKRFSAAFKIARVTVVTTSAGEWRTEDLRARIIATQEVLTDQVQAVHREFEAAIDRYRQLDDVVPDAGVANGAAAA